MANPVTPTQFDELREVAWQVFAILTPQALVNQSAAHHPEPIILYEALVHESEMRQVGLYRHRLDRFPADDDCVLMLRHLRLRQPNGDTLTITTYNPPRLAELGVEFSPGGQASGYTYRVLYANDDVPPEIIDPTATYPRNPGVTAIHIDRLMNVLKSYLPKPSQ